MYLQRFIPPEWLRSLAHLRARNPLQGYWRCAAVQIFYLVDEPSSGIPRVAALALALVRCKIFYMADEPYSGILRVAINRLRGSCVSKSRRCGTVPILGLADEPFCASVHSFLAATKFSTCLFAPRCTIYYIPSVGILHVRHCRR